MGGNVEVNHTLANLKGKITPIPDIDNTLTKEGYAADAKATGDAIAAIQERLDTLETK